MSIPETNPRREAATSYNIAAALVESGIPVLRCCTGLKTPHKDAEGT
jgi:hypothetical protein